MAIHLQRDLDRLKKELLQLGSIVEESIDKAIDALLDRRLELAQEVLEGDDVVDAKEVHVEEECLKILALHQPVAADLRFLVTVLKVTNDLERMGDLAVNVSERASYLAVHEPLRVSLDFRSLGDNVRSMVRESLDCLVRLDTDLAEKVRRADDVVDDITRRMFDQLEALMAKESATVKRALHALSSARHLERIADLAVSIADDVIFLVKGEVVRHIHPTPSGT
jgi:phosphate transport system protein